MKKLAVTTVARWMTERLLSGITAYMEYQDGRLYRLERIENYNDWLQPVFTYPDSRLGEFTSEKGVYTFSSPVYLSMNPDLTKVNFADLVDTMELVATDDWVTRITPRDLIAMYGKPARSRWVVWIGGCWEITGLIVLACLITWLFSLCL